MMIDGKQMSIDEAIMSAGKDGMMSKSLKKTIFLPVTIATLNDVDKHHYLPISCTLFVTSSFSTCHQSCHFIFAKHYLANKAETCRQSKQ